MAEATQKIQKVFRGHQARQKVKEIKASKEGQNQDLPDLHCADVAAATIKIQKVYRGK